MEAKLVEAAPAWTISELSEEQRSQLAQMSPADRSLMRTGTFFALVGLGARRHEDAEPGADKRAASLELLTLATKLESDARKDGDMTNVDEAADLKAAAIEIAPNDLVPVEPIRYKRRPFTCLEKIYWFCVYVCCCVPCRPSMQ